MIVKINTDHSTITELKIAEYSKIIYNCIYKGNIYLND